MTADPVDGPDRPAVEDDPELRRLRTYQDGVVSRRQVLALGHHDHDARRLVRRRAWAVVHPGVHVDHTGPPTWQQRAWAAVPATAPSALFGVSALRSVDGPGRRGDDDGPLHVAVARGRSLHPPAGVVVHRLADVDALVLLHTSPPRQRTEHAVLEVAARAVDEQALVAALADAVRCCPRCPPGGA